jgi:restriction system protein
MLDAKGDKEMAVPDYQSVMLPLLQFAARKGTEISTSEAVEALATELGLTEDDLKEMLPSGIQSTFVNRVGWAT